MIFVNDVITYLRSNINSMNIGGCAEFQAAQDDSRLMKQDGNFVQSLFVILDNYTGLEDAVNPMQPRQEVDERVVIIACIDNTQDRTGQHAQQLVPSIRSALLSLLYNNNQFDTNSTPLQYVGDRILPNTMDRARYWHRFEYRCKGMIDVSDGVSFNFDQFNKMVNTWNSDDADYVDNPLMQDEITGLYES